METIEKKNCLLDQPAISNRIRRMALEVAEQNIEEEELIIAAINGHGELVAKYLINELKEVFLGKTRPLIIHLNKKDPVEVYINETADLENKAIIVVDDVANTGKTLLFALKPFLNMHPKKIQTLVLVERSHKLFPIQTDYKGLSVSTTLQEHISVVTSEGIITGAWLY